MSKDDNKPVEFEDDQDTPKKKPLDDDIPLTVEERFKTKAMDAMEKTAILEPEADEEKTQLIENPFLIPARLIVVFGADQGREFTLIAPETVVGRALDCDVVLNDPTVSKHHCKIVREREVYFIEDLGSGNGTKLNGTKIKLRSRIMEGVRIELGRTVLTFSTKASGLPQGMPQGQVAMPDRNARTLATEVPQPRAMKQPVIQPLKSREEPEEAEQVVVYPPWLKILVVALLVLVVVGIGIAVVHWGFGGHNATKQPQRVVQKVSPHEKALKLYNKGLGYMGDKMWDKAIASFRKALDLDPELGRASRRLVEVQKEKQVMETLQKADQLIKQNKPSQAKALLAAVPQSSVYFTKARSKLIQLTDKQAELGVKKVKTLLAAGNSAQAKQVFMDLLTRYPNNTDVMALGKLFKNPSGTTPKATPPKPRPVKRRRFRHRAHRAKLDMKTVLSMYAGGAFSDAVDELRSYVRSVHNSKEKLAKKQLADAIQSFAAVYTAGKQAVNAGNYTVAIRNLSQAKRLDRGISGHYQSELKTLLARSYRGRSAQYVMKKMYVQAARDARAALALNPGDQASLMVLNKCHTVARQYYNSALADLKSGNTASAKTKLIQVMRLVTRDSDLYRQASTRYQQIR